MGQLYPTEHESAVQLFHQQVTVKPKVEMYWSGKDPNLNIEKKWKSVYSDFKSFQWCCEVNHFFQSEEWSETIYCNLMSYREMISCLGPRQETSQGVFHHLTKDDR